MIYVGIDLSVNHSGVVVWKESKSNYNVYSYFLTNEKIIRPKSEYFNGMLFEKYNEKIHFSSERYNVRRLNWHLDFMGFVFDRTPFRKNPQEVIIIIEDYMLSRLSSSYPYQIGEVGGCVRQCLYNKGFNLRYINPKTLKKWVGDGSYKKKDMVLKAEEQGYKIPKSLLKIPKNKKKDWSGVGTDLADAYFLMEFGKSEYLFRQGTLRLGDSVQKQREILLQLIYKEGTKSSVMKPYISIKYPEEKIIKRRKIRRKND